MGGPRPGRPARHVLRRVLASSALLLVLGPGASPAAAAAHVGDAADSAAESTVLLQTHQSVQEASPGTPPAAAPAAARGGGGADSDAESAVLLQTYHSVQDASSGGLSLASNQSSPYALGGAGHAAWDSLCLQPYPLQLQLGLESIRALGYTLPRTACHWMEQHATEGRSVVLLERQPWRDPASWGFVGVLPLSAPVGYLAFCVGCALLIFRRASWAAPGERDSEDKGGRDPEGEAWRQGWLSWMLMDWASHWVSRWGFEVGSSPTKIRPDEVQVLCDPRDGCIPCFQRFDQLWRQEVHREGIERASLLKVVIRFVTYRKFFAIVAWIALYESCLFLGPPLAIEWITTYVSWLYVKRMSGAVVPQSELVGPSLVTIAIFTGIPIVIAISYTVSSMTNGRVGVQVTGALASAVLRKGQLLPVSPADEDDHKDAGEDTASEAGSSEAEGGEKAAQGRSQGCRTMDDEEAVPQRFSLVQLVTTDVAMNIMVIPLALARVVVMIPVTIVMFGLLCRKLGWAFLFCVGVTAPMVFSVIVIGAVQKRYLLKFMNLSGKRLHLFQQIMFGIRLVKCFGMESIYLGRLETYRKKELQALNGYYAMMCFMFQAQWQFPRLYLLASLGGYTMLYGDIPVTSIIAIVPLLNSFQSCVGSLVGFIPALVSAKPSCMRLEAFLKAPVAPHFLPPATPGTGIQTIGAELNATPDWIVKLPEAKAVEEAGVLRAQGSFGWRPESSAALRDLEVVVPRGQLVAVLGPAGAGKTTLLHVLLGEMYPMGDARIQVPGRIAYSAQVPHIIEGSVRDNVLYMEPFDEARYTAAVRAAGLLPDHLEGPPGAEEVHIGSRGVALSSSQRARISMARAAYSRGTDVVLLDDSLGATDSRTAWHVTEHLLNGPIMEGRTRIVVCQPDSERLMCFDQVMILYDGRVEVQGAPQEVIQTNAYKKLLAGGAAQPPPDGNNTALTNHGMARGPAGEFATARGGHEDTIAGSRLGNGDLREEEYQGRASWETFAYFCRTGGRLSITLCILMFLVKSIFDMAVSMVLASWTTDSALAEGSNGRPPATAYLLKFGFWWSLSIAAWFLCWAGGHLFTLTLSRGCHQAVVSSLLRAPVDKFYDKTPVGRILNRMSNDMMNVDLQVFVRLCGSMGVMWSICVPLVYVHAVMPRWFSVLSLPCYCLLLMLLRMYWKTMVPLRYLTEVCKSSVSNDLTEVETSCATVRAFGKQDAQLRQFQLAMADFIRARFVSGTALRCWLGCRLLVLGSFFITCLGLVVIWVPGALDVGRASLCMVAIFSILSSIESTVEAGALAQFQAIAMNRIHEYTRLPEELPEELVTDKTYMDFDATIPRLSLGALQVSTGSCGGLEVTRRTTNQVLLRQVPDRPGFVAAAGLQLADLAPDCVELRLADGWHRIARINGVAGDAAAIAEELCSGSSDRVALHIQSGWLGDGCEVRVQGLRAAYAGPGGEEVLRGVDLRVPRRCVGAVVGAPGSGKSTLLWCVLRMLEPRQGRILLEGINTKNLGLRTLRGAVGVVPQEPVLLEGSVRSNIDPCGHSSDSAILEALRRVQLEDCVAACGGLGFQIAEEGANLSYGHRQLMCLARLLLRQPKLILLDEALSALDPHTRELIQSTFKELFPDSTIILTTKHAETAVGAGLIAVIDHGEIVESGSLPELTKCKDTRLAAMLASHQGRRM